MVELIALLSKPPLASEIAQLLQTAAARELY